MPALEMAQDKGKLLRWLKPDGARVTKGEPIMEIETDKVTVEIEAPADGVLTNLTAHEGDVVPVGQTIAMIVDSVETGHTPSLQATPVARRIAEEHGIDLAQVKPGGGRIEKADVLAFVKTTADYNPRSEAERDHRPPTAVVDSSTSAQRVLASPKAKRLAQERGIDLASLRGTGPQGAIIASDVPLSLPTQSIVQSPSLTTDHAPLSTTWRVMAERMSQSWTSAPHFYLVREVNASRLIAWRESVNKRAQTNITFTDLLAKIVAVALREHPRVNVAWNAGAIVQQPDVNIGLAVAIEEGLIVPVVHRADTLSIAQIAARRQDVVARAQAGKLKLDDLQGGTFTISNLGMYGVDAFNAIVNPPQAAILAVGRIAERVVAIDGKPAVQPMMTLTLSCDHRAIDGARGAPFLATIADFIEDPLRII
jgi:pyruvate dehydrogenase E2 component (dihydrolipoamide acetyltransferase)